MTEELTQKPKDEGTIRISKKTIYIVFGAILLLAIGFAMGWLVKPSVTGAVVEGPNAPDTELGRVDVNIEGEPAIGNPEAKVTIIEFTDFQCPYCKRAFDNAFLQIKRDYIDTNKVLYVAKDFPLSFHTEADDASEAANCADDQGKYWEMHDMIYAGQAEWSGQATPNAVFSGYASELGLDTNEFDSCLASDKYAAEIQQDISEGLQAGIKGTPTFLINGQQVVGAQPYDAFKSVIESELAK